MEQNCLSDMSTVELQGDEVSAAALCFLSINVGASGRGNMIDICDTSETRCRAVRKSHRVFQDHSTTVSVTQGTKTDV